MLPKPEPPQDFKAARDQLKQKYENGDLDQDEYLDQREQVTLAEAEFKGRLASWETHNEAVKAQNEAAATTAFNDVALAWEKQHADFIANDLRRDAMQAAIAAVDKRTGGTLSPAALFEQAQKIAFEAFNYTPPGGGGGDGAPTKTPEQIAADALKDRKADTSQIPATLANAPQAASLDPNNSNYDSIDKQDIDSLENTVARMSPDQQEKWLADAPGANQRGAD